jgi:hypothetical protein
MSGATHKTPDDIVKAKVVLYRYFIQTPYTDLTMNEIEIGYQLAKDKDIQKILAKGVKHENHQSKGKD